MYVDSLSLLLRTENSNSENAFYAFRYYDPYIELTMLQKYVHALVCVPLRPLYQFLLPRILFSTVELSIWGWEFRDKGAIHEKLGPTFILVTTGQNRLVSADPVLAQHILVKRNAFVHPEVTTQAMGFLGANIVTVNIFPTIEEDMLSLARFWLNLSRHKERHGLDNAASSCLR